MTATDDVTVRSQGGMIGQAGATLHVTIDLSSHAVRCLVRAGLLGQGQGNPFEAVNRLVAAALSTPVAKGRLGLACDRLAASGDVEIGRPTPTDAGVPCA